MLTTVVGLISNNDKTAYREDVRTLTEWCRENNLSLNVNKTMEMIVDYSRQQRELVPIHFYRVTLERTKSFKLLGVHITINLK